MTFEEALEKLPRREALALRCYYGIGEPRRFTLREIGHMLGVTGGRAGQLRNQAWERMWKMTEGKTLGRIAEEMADVAERLTDLVRSDEEKAWIRMCERFLAYVRAEVDYWESESQRPDVRGKLEGLASSILVALDGEAGDLPGYIVKPLLEGTNREDPNDIAGFLHEQIWGKRFRTPTP